MSRRARTARAFVLRSLADVGARPAVGSDAPVAPLDPWVAIAAATSRTRDGRSPWHPEQVVSVDAALAASTRGSIAVGGVADFVATDIDPLEATDQELRRMSVSLTLLGGRITHRTL